MFCLHKSSVDFKLHGSYLTGKDYSAFDIWLAACGSRITLYNGKVVGGHDDCAWDKQEVKEYLGNGFFLNVYHNQQFFRQSVYGSDSIEKKAAMSKIFSTNDGAVFTEGFVQKLQVNDESDVFQIGQVHQWELNQVLIGQTIESAQKNWPTRENPTPYKLNSVYMELKQK